MESKLSPIQSLITINLTVDDRVTLAYGLALDLPIPPNSGDLTIPLDTGNAASNLQSLTIFTSTNPQIKRLEIRTTSAYLGIYRIAREQWLGFITNNDSQNLSNALFTLNNPQDLLSLIVESGTIIKILLRLTHNKRLSIYIDSGMQPEQSLSAYSGEVKDDNGQEIVYYTNTDSILVDRYYQITPTGQKILDGEERYYFITGAPMKFINWHEGLKDGIEELWFIHFNGEEMVSSNLPLLLRYWINGQLVNSEQYWQYQKQITQETGKYTGLIPDLLNITRDYK